MDTEGAAEREGQGDPEEHRSRLPDRSGPPDLRVSDAERAAALQALGTHLEAGRLDIDEFGERSARAAVAVHRSDLEPLFVDLPAPHPPLPHPHVAPPPPVPAAPARRARAGPGPPARPGRTGPRRRAGDAARARAPGAPRGRGDHGLGRRPAGAPAAVPGARRAARALARTRTRGPRARREARTTRALVKRGVARPPRMRLGLPHRCAVLWWRQRQRREVAPGSRDEPGATDLSWIPRFAPPRSCRARDQRRRDPAPTLLPHGRVRRRRFEVPPRGAQGKLCPLWGSSNGSCFSTSPGRRRGRRRRPRSTTTPHRCTWRSPATCSTDAATCC